MIEGKYGFVELINWYVCVYLFFTDDHPQPFIVRQPETVVALRGDNVSLVCTAASSSDSPVRFAWKKDNKVRRKVRFRVRVRLKVL